jgi:hypothetical protein
MLNTIHKSLDLPHKWDADEIHQIIRFLRTKRFIKLQHVGYEWILVPRTEHTGNYSAYQREIISLQHISSNIHKLTVKINTPYKLHTKWWGSLKRVRPLKCRCQENHSSKTLLSMPPCQNFATAAFRAMRHWRHGPAWFENHRDETGFAFPQFQKGTLNPPILPHEQQSMCDCVDG